MSFRRIAATTGICLALASAVLAVEILVAIRAPRLAATAPYDLDRRIEDENASRVVWLGDSTAAGVGASVPEGALPSLVANATQGQVDLSVLAVSGAGVEDVVSGQLPKLLGIRPDVVYISVGANDVTGFTSKDDFERRYEELLAGIPESTRVVMLGVPDMGSPTRIPQPLRSIVGLRGNQLDAVVAELADKRHHTYVDIEGATREQFRNRPEEYFASDRFHPNDTGYGLWADAVLAPSIR